MANFVYPADAVTGSPTYTGRALRETLAPLLSGATAARPLGARSGVRPGTSATTVTATSTVWTVGPVAGVMDVQTAVEAGPYLFACNAAQTGAVTAAHATLARVDIVYIRLDDPAESDGTATPLVVAGYLAGTAAGSPVAPAAPARCLVLANVNVPASGGGAPTVSWVARVAVAAGAVIPVVSQAERDALTLRDGLQVYRLDQHLVETYVNGAWSGGAWTSYIPAWTSQGTAPVLGNGTLTGAYKRQGNDVLYKIRLTPGSTTTFGTGNYLLSLPIPAAGSVAFDCMGNIVAVIAGVRYSGAPAASTPSTVLIVFGSTLMTPTAPGTFASTNTVSVNGTYESV